MPALVYTAETGDRKSQEIDKDRLTIGRLEENDVVLEDPLVSRNHCYVERRGEEYVLVDLGSTYGTFVNDQKVDFELTLTRGDRVRIGTTAMTFATGDGETFIEEPPARDETKPLVRSMLADSGRLAVQLEDALIGRKPNIEEAKVLAGAIAEQMFEAEKALAELEMSQRLHRTLSEVGKLISSVTDLATVIRLTMDLAISSLGADRGFILLRDEGGTLTPRATRNMEREVRALVRRGISQSIAATVAEDGRPVLTTDAQIDPRFKESDSVMAHDIRAVMCVPMRNKEMKNTGAIYVDGPPSSPLFGKRGLAFLESFASQATVAIENAQLIEKIALEEKLRERLSRYFSPSVVNDILEGEEELTTQGSARVVTVLFTDIRGSTRILERLKPEEAVEMLNDFFEEIVEEVLAEDGTLDKFTGDGFMAFWGAPQDQADHAHRAIRAALKMQEKLPGLRNRWRIEGRPFARETGGLRMGIGIHTGEVVVGDVGSSTRIEYTAIGDAVNVTARIQGCAKGGDVLITNSTLELVKKDIDFQTLDPVTVKGKTDPIAIFKVDAIRVKPTKTG